jgi:hypothetical protein
MSQQAQEEIDDDSSSSSLSLRSSICPARLRSFAGLDVDHHSIAATFTDHDRLMQSLCLPYSAPQLLNYVRKHFPQQRLAFVYEAGPTGFGLYDELVAAGYPRLVVARPWCRGRRENE